MNKKLLKVKELGQDINPSLFDTDRLIPKANGGTYIIGNVRVLKPVDHMKHHGNYKERDEQLGKVKTLIDAREQYMKSLYSGQNRILAYDRKTDHIDQSTMDFLKEQCQQIQKVLSKHDRIIEKEIRNSSLDVAKSALEVIGVGPITIAYCLAYLDIEKAENASSFWKYAGLHAASHERYEKNVSGGGNKKLRTVLFNLATSIEKNPKSPYRLVYERTKARLAASEKITKTRNTQGKLIEAAWKDTKPGHRRGAALRAVMKHFLADLWLVWRTMEGLPTRPLYVQEYLGHTGIIQPKERGWVY